MTRLLLLLGAFASLAAAQPTTSRGPVVLPQCSATRTTNCTVKVDGSGNAVPAIGSTASTKVRPCEQAIGDPGAATGVLVDDNDASFVCGNLTGAAMTISKVECRYLPAGGTAPIVNVSITGGSTVLTSNLTCGSGSFASSTVLSITSQAAGESLDVNLITAGGTAKYVVIRVTRTL